MWPDYGVLILAQQADGAGSVGFNSPSIRVDTEASRGLASGLARRDDLAGTRMGVRPAWSRVLAQECRRRLADWHQVAFTSWFVHGRIMAARRRAEGDGLSREGLATETIGPDRRLRRAIWTRNTLTGRSRPLGSGSRSTALHQPDLLSEAT